MVVLGISASPRGGSVTATMVRQVLSTVECKTEYVSLAGMNIGPCRACLRCAGDNECKVSDDMQKLRTPLLEADAIVFGAPNYYGTFNALAHCFWERCYQYRHREEMLLSGKLGAVVGTGGGDPGAAVAAITRCFEHNGIELTGSVTALGPNGCYTCGYGENCGVGAVVGRHGAGTEITDEIIPSLDTQPEKLEQAAALGRRLSEMLNLSSQDRPAV